MIMADLSRKRKSTNPSGKKHKKPKQLELKESLVADYDSPEEIDPPPPPPPTPDDGLKRMVKMATIFQSPEFQDPKKILKKEKAIQHMTKIGPYDPQVYAFVEETRAALEPKPEDVEQTQASLEPQLEEGEIQTLLEDLQLSDHEPMVSPSKVDYMICPCHLVRLEDRQSSQGWNYVKCPKQPCLLFCGKDQAAEYMCEVYKNVHPDICDRWETLVCLCGQVPTLRQSHSEKNPNKLYLSCGSIAPHRCRFFRWADQQIRRYDPTDPLSVHQWLTEDPAPPPPKYSDSLQNWEKSLKTVEYDMPESVKNWYNRTGLF